MRAAPRTRWRRGGHGGRRQGEGQAAADKQMTGVEGESVDARPSHATAREAGQRVGVAGRRQQGEEAAA